ncbi:MAG: V-type ATPase 116kDa subunit family protein, partial [Bacilli bacterium]|nr:V-type ATPase 116kDa subunit family protein [Bacilli bacterium]
MKKAKLVVMKDDKEKLLSSLQKAGVFMPIPTEEKVPAGDASLEEALLQRTEKSLKVIGRYREKKGFVRQETLVGYEEFINVEYDKAKKLDEIEEIDERISHLETENLVLEEQIDYYLPWQDLDIRLSDLENSKHTIIHVGFQKANRIEDLKLNVLEFGGEIKELGIGPEGVAFVFINYHLDDDAVMEKVKSLGFLEVNLPKIDKLARTIIFETETQIIKNTEEIASLKAKLSDFAKSADTIELLSDQLASVGALKNSPLTETLETVYLEGWVRSDEVKIFERTVKKATELYDLEIVAADPEDNPPTYTKNNRFVRPFETITDMFSIPTATDVDPNPTMSIWYWFIFGMMMGDVGYGVLMIALFYLLIKLRKPKGESLKLFKVLLYSGISTIFWGVMFGSYFGYTFYPIFLEPMSDLTEYLIFSFVVGGLHIITGICVAGYQNIKAGKPLDAVFDQFSWVILMAGLGLIFLPDLKNVGLALIIIGLAIIIIMGGRKKNNLFSKLFGGIFSLTNV